MKGILAAIILPISINLFASARPPAITFDSCDATSTNRDGVSTAEFVAGNALTSGLDFWCSEAGLDATEEIIWKGSFAGVTELKGLEIVWAYSPQQIKILGRSDPNAAEHVILNWRSAIVQAVDSSSDNKSTRTAEKIEFPRGVEALSSIKVVMKGTTNSDGYIGIQQVRAIGSEDQIFTLISGIKSPKHEQCLQAAGDTSVVVDDCLYGIAHGDGRDIWQLTRDGQMQLTQASDPELCLHYQSVKSGSSESSSAPVDYNLGLHSCSESDSRFDYLPNSQIKTTVEKSNLCLVVLGKLPGFTNYLADQTTGAEASTSMDVDHEANNALTPDSTYWSSTAFASCAEHAVYWQYDLGSPNRVDRVSIDWEYPPLSYSIMTSLDGANFRQTAFNPANPHNRTEDYVGQSIRFMRISMFKPHPIFGQLGGSSNGTQTLSSKSPNYVYGIRTVLIQQNVLSLALKDCALAASFQNSGDKWFKYPVRLFDADIANRIKTNANFDGGLKSVQDSTSELYDRLPQAADCEKRARSLITKYSQNIQEPLPDLQLRISALQQKPITASGDTCGSLTHSAMPGMTYDTPLSGNLGCRRGAAPGFYYFSIPCAVSKILRLFCTDDGDGLWLYTGARTKSRRNTLDIERACATEGLRPTPVRSIRQLDLMIIMLAMQRISFDDSTSNVPLGFDLGCASSPSGCMEMYYDLATVSDVTGILSQRRRVSTSLVQHNAALAITSLSKTTPIDLVDWVSSNQLGYMCATAAGSRSTGLVAKLECGTTALSAIFKGGPNTFFKVACPATCQHTVAGHPVYGGREGAYADRSSVCTAALHRYIKNLDGFLIALESPHAAYPSITANGISSKALTGPTSLAFRVMEADSRCPVEDLIAAADAASVQTVAMKPTTLVIPPSQDWQSAFDLGAKKASGASLNRSAVLGPANNATLIQRDVTETYISHLSKIDGTSVTYSRQTSMTGLTEGRAVIKPLETTLARFTSKSDNVYMELAHQVRQTLTIVAAFFTKLEETQRLIQQISTQRNRRIKAIKMDASTKIEQFETLPNGAGTLTWSLGSPRSADSKRSVIKVTGFSEPSTPDGDFIEGQPFVMPYQTYIAHRSNYIYDFSLSVQITLNNREDILMVGWRVKKASGDGYWLLLKQSPSELPTDVPPAESILAKLVRRSQGRVSVLIHWVYATVNDPDQFVVDVQVNRAAHVISIDGKQVINLLDELAMSGFLAAGVYEMVSGSSAEFDFISATPNCCQRPRIRAMASASHHGQVFLESPDCYRWDGSYSVLSAAQLFDSRSTISKQRNYLGRPTVFEAKSFIQKETSNFMQSSALTPQIAHTISPQPVLLKPRGRPQLCSAGVYALDFILPSDCPDVEVGPIVGKSLKEYEWVAINSLGLIRAYKVSNTAAPLTVVADTYLDPIRVDEWHTISTVLTETSIGVALFDAAGKSQGQFTTIRQNSGSAYLGLAFQGCDRIPFARLRVRP